MAVDPRNPTTDPQVVEVNGNNHRDNGLPLVSVSYVPDEVLYRARQVQNLSDPNRLRELPHGFPTEIKTAAVWEGKDLANEETWRIFLDEEDRTDIHQALRAFQNTRLEPSKITKKTFKLQSKLLNKLESASEALHNGLGLAAFRGLQPEQYSPEENVILFAGLMAYIGDTRGYHSPESTDVIGHIHDLTPYYSQTELKSPTYTRTKMPFHTDNADILCLYVLNTGTGGGTFKIASSGLIYNKLAVDRPDLIQALSNDYLFDCYIDNGEPYARPLLFYRDGKIIMQAFRRPFTGFASLKRRTSLPGLTMAQAEALDAIHFYAEDNCIPVVFHKGDLVLLNNHCVVHARDKTDLRVEDGETNTVSTESPQTKRHLLKMFVRDQDRAWPVPEELKRDWEVLYGLRGKTKEDRVETFRMVPQTEGKLANGWTQNG